MTSEQKQRYTSFREKKLINRNKTIKRLCDREIELRKAINRTELDEDEIVELIKHTNPYNTLSPELKKQVDKLEFNNPVIYYRLFPMRKIARMYHEKLRQIFNYDD